MEVFLEDLYSVGWVHKKPHKALEEAGGLHHCLQQTVHKLLNTQRLSCKATHHNGGSAGVGDTHHLSSPQGTPGRAALHMVLKTVGLINDRKRVLQGRPLLKELLAD